MLRHAVRAVCPKEPANDIRVVPVRPYSSLRKVRHKILFWPEGIRRYRRACLTLIARLSLTLLHSEKSLNASVLARMFIRVLVAVYC